MNEDTLYAQFDQYINKQLAEADRLAFEQRLKDDPAFKNEFSAYLGNLADIYKSGFQADKQMLAQQKLQMQQQYRSQKLHRRRRILMMAAAFVMLFAMIFLLLPSEKLSAEELYANYYKAPEAPAILDVDQDSLLRQADLSYTAKAYAEARQAYQQLEKDSFPAPERARIAFYEGICALEMNDFDAARGLLVQAGTQRSQEASWYIAMSWLKAGDWTQAQEILEVIANDPKLYYRAQAKEILEKGK